MPTADTTKVYKSSAGAKASVEVSETSASLIGDSRHFVVADERGVSIKGPISFISSGEQIRTGGLFVKMPDMLSMIPSTLVTPLPQHIPLPPVHGLQNIQSDVAFFMSLLL